MNSNQKSELPFLSNIGLMLTYKCTIACPHCIVRAGPKRKEEILLEDAYNWINQIINYKNNEVIGISLTGGEPFYNLELLKLISDYASSFDLIVTAVTNAYWANTKDEAIVTLSSLKNIKVISVSTDLEHQKHIPFTKIKNAVWALKKLGIAYNIAVTIDNQNSEKYLNILDELLEITEKENIVTGITIQLGRAKNNITKYAFKKTVNPDDSACSMANYPIIFPNGDIIACIGSPIAIPKPHPLYLGNLKTESLASILNRVQDNYILHAIRVWGPAELVRLMKEFGYENLIPKEYIADSICDVCCQLFSDRKINELLENISTDAKFKEKVAYGRLYYLQESNMVEKHYLLN